MRDNSSLAGTHVTLICRVRIRVAIT